MKHFNKFLAMIAVVACFGMVSCCTDHTQNKPTTGTENGHDSVDLGLTSGTKWATCNVGADAPEYFGSYFAWGETETKSSYGWSTYFDTKDGGYTFVKYNNNGGKTELEDADDVAVQTWGGKWSMPTLEQQIELRDECYWVWTNTYNGKSVIGYIVYKAKKEDDKGVKVYSENDADASYDVGSDAHIFLPAAGYRDNGSLGGAGGDGYYWSRSLGAFNSRSAYALGFYSDGVDTGSDDSRYYGQSVRPVCPATK